MDEGPRARPSVRMSDDEIWQFVGEGHTGVLTTLRRDGTPIALPVWYATIERRVYVVTRGRKLARIGHDPRATFLVEDGVRWAELRAVHLVGRARIVEPDPSLAEAIRQQLDDKYAAFRTPAAAMPEQSRRHYDRTPGTTVEFVPDPGERILNWDNGKLALDRRGEQ